MRFCIFLMDWQHWTNFLKMQERKRNSGPRALILAPTRELAQQIESEINQIVGVCAFF